MVGHVTSGGQVEVKPWSKWHERHNEKEGDVIRGNQRNLKNHGCEKNSITSRAPSDVASAKEMRKWKRRRWGR